MGSMVGVKSQMRLQMERHGAGIGWLVRTGGPTHHHHLNIVNKQHPRQYGFIRSSLQWHHPHHHHHLKDNFLSRMMLRLARRELLRWSARYLGGLPPPQGSRCSQKRWRKYWMLSKHKSTPMQDDSEVCITDAQSLDRLSLQSQEELEEVNLERYLQVVSAVIMSSSFFTTRPSSPLWSSPLSQPGCRPRSKLVEGLWLSARWSHRSSEVHRLPTAGVQVQIFALGLRLLLLFCVLPLCTSFFIII